MEAIDPEMITELYIPAGVKRSSILPQLIIRANVIRDIWSIPPGSRVLEIGCGQGDTTIVLAAAVGDSGYVDAVDPAPLSYGGPVTIGTSQMNLKASALGNRITFHSADPEEYLTSFSGPPYDYVVFFQSLWYFSDEARIERILRMLKDGKERFASKLLIAEWALQASSKEAWPHVLAALSIANLEMKMVEHSSNICSPVSPKWFRAFFAKENMLLVKEEILTPPKECREGMWEVNVVLDEHYGERIRAALVGNQRARLASDAIHDAVVAAFVQAGNNVKELETMDIWTGVIDLGAK